MSDRKIGRPKGAKDPLSKKIRRALQLAIDAQYIDTAKALSSALAVCVVEEVDFFPED